MKIEGPNTSYMDHIDPVSLSLPSCTTRPSKSQLWSGLDIRPILDPPCYVAIFAALDRIIRKGKSYKLDFDQIHRSSFPAF